MFLNQENILWIKSSILDSSLFETWAAIEYDTEYSVSFITSNKCFVQFLFSMILLILTVKEGTINCNNLQRIRLML